MALKTNFEATNVISSPFVDEVANPGHTVSERQAKAQRVGSRAALSDKQRGTIARMDKQIADAKAPKGDQRNTGQKIMDKDQKIREALDNTPFQRTASALDSLRKKAKN